jgi:hypothetical protein
MIILVMLKKQKISLLALLEGYKKTNELIMRERVKRLAEMGADDSTREYDYLCRLYSGIKKKGLGKLENQKILFLIKRRKIFNKAGIGRKKIDESTI